MTRRIVTVITLLLGAAQADGNELAQLYELALTRDTTLEAARFQQEAAIEARPQALAALLPQVAAGATAARDRETYEAAATVLGNNSVDCPAYANDGMQRCVGNTRTFGLTLTQTLWSFQAFSQLKEANLQAASAEATYRGARQNLLLRVAEAYFAILSAADALATNRSERQAFATLLDQAKARQLTGIGPRSDVEQAQAFYDATEQPVIDAENAVDDAQLAMLAIVGSATLHVAPLRDDIPLASPDPASADEWVASSRQDNFEVRAAELKMEAASRDIAAQQGRGLPTLSLIGSGSKTAQDQSLGGAQSFDTIGVSFNWPLLQGGAIASAVRQSRALYRQAEALYESAERDTERLTRASFRGVVSGIRRIGAARRAVESGRGAVEASRRNVEFGTGTEFDLLNAQNNYYAAQRAYSQARYDYLTSVLTLKQQAGRLSEHDLDAIDELLLQQDRS
jgi:outer membrane protein